MPATATRKERAQPLRVAIRTFEAPSESRSEVYSVILYSDHSMFCTRPAFRFQRKPVEERTCKHIRAIHEGRV